MTIETTKEPNLEAAIKALEVLAEKPNIARLTTKERIAEPRLYAAIRKAQQARHSVADIASTLKAEGIDVAPSTLSVYLREIASEQRGDNDAKATKKRKGTETANASGASKATSGEDIGSKPEAAGKTLTKKPAMGGGFSPENL